MQAHEVRDEDRFAAQDKRFDSQDLMLAQIQDSIKGLATEKSIRDLVHWQKNLIMAGQFLTTGGKWSKRALLTVAAIIGAIGVILGGWKVIIGFFFVPKI